MAIDEGGPTKHFSDQVWRQLPELKVKKVKVQKVEKEVPLFDKYGVPSPDDRFESGNSHVSIALVTKKVKKYYRAVGRIMSQALIRGYLGQGRTVSWFGGAGGGCCRV